MLTVQIDRRIRVILNKSMDTGIFPDRCKTAKVTLVHNSNVKNDHNNYRPISVLPIVGKVFEKFPVIKGDTMHLPTLKNFCKQGIELSSDTPVFATPDVP